MKILMLLAASCVLAFPLSAAESVPASPGDAMLARWFERETTRLQTNSLAAAITPGEWPRQRSIWRGQLQEMLGLTPEPPRSNLLAAVTGRLEQPDIVVENIHFQSLPGLYVTGNLYLPRHVTNALPTILYLSGHAQVTSNSVSYGNKVAYQHHGTWFAQHGYACLILDTLQLGEIEGLHHGTYREGMWWWNSRGYTPAGVEAWNSMRALDYLSTRPEVDTNRFGVTGRSGGGAYSWFTAALDDRIKAAAPVAGITDLENHVLDGAVAGHCDCMFFINKYRWDYPQLAALLAPRPLLIVNTDNDPIFPLDGVLRTFQKVKRVYGALDATNRLGLVIGPGPHKDSQDLQVPVLRWFNHFLKREESIIAQPAVARFRADQLKVFETLPGNSINGRIQETFATVAGAPPLPVNVAEWKPLRDRLVSQLTNELFRAWPNTAAPSVVRAAYSAERGGITLDATDFEPEPGVTLRLYAFRSTGVPVTNATLTLLDAPAQFGGAELARAARSPASPTWEAWVAAASALFPGPLREEVASLNVGQRADVTLPDVRPVETNRTVHYYLAPRGVGLNAWTGSVTRLTHVRRRFALLGTSVDEARVWDLRRAVQAITTLPGHRDLPITIKAGGESAGLAVYAAILEPRVAGLELWNLPRSHQQGPEIPGVMQIMDLPQALALAAERVPVRLHDSAGPWLLARHLTGQLGWSATGRGLYSVE